MRNTYFLKALIIIALSFALCGCEEEQTANSPIHFTVYGTVYDHSTGEPVNGAEITLYYGTHTPGLGSSKPSGAAGSSVSGLDGQFRIPCIATRNLISENNHMYQIEASCVGHKDYSKKVTIMETEGVEIQIDILLE